MPEGLEVFNDAGQRVIDPEIQNFGLIASGRVTTSAIVGNFRYHDIVSAGRVSPILALNAGGNWVGILGVSISGSTYTWRVVTLSAANVDYWLFDETPVVENFGLEVFNAAGDRVYHSGIGAMRVVGFVEGGQGYQGDYSSVVDEKIAIAQSRPGRIDLYFSEGEFGIGGEPGDVVKRYSHGVQFDTSKSFNINYNEFGETSGSGSNVSDPNPDLLVIDVSNLGAYGVGDPPPDIVPNAVNWANISDTDNRAENSNQTISGIDVTITLEATCTDPDITIFPIVNGTTLNAGPFTVDSGDTVRFEAFHSQQSAQSGTVTVANNSDGGTTLDTFTVSLAASGDVTPNAVNWADISPAGNSGTNANQTINGITQDIELDIDTSGSVVTVVYLNNVSQGAITSLTVSDGDQVYFECTNFTVNPVSESVVVRNVDDGNVILDTFNVNLAASGGGF